MLGSEHKFSYKAFSFLKIVDLALACFFPSPAAFSQGVGQEYLPFHISFQVFFLFVPVLRSYS